ncbi:MAG: hypothetical protein J3R72DRAFT_526946 [Linnemannia gamsii]|nr:MAG: hypothetical protein J3R72DRAFT_526946 [Linnemannia gamsii]
MTVLKDFTPRCSTNANDNTDNNTRCKSTRNNSAEFITAFLRNKLNVRHIKTTDPEFFALLAFTHAMVDCLQSLDLQLDHEAPSDSSTWSLECVQETAVKAKPIEEPVGPSTLSIYLALQLLFYIHRTDNSDSLRANNNNNNSSSYSNSNYGADDGNGELPLSTPRSTHPHGLAFLRKKITFDALCNLNVTYLIAVLSTYALGLNQLTLIGVGGMSHSMLTLVLNAGKSSWRALQLTGVSGLEDMEFKLFMRSVSRTLRVVGAGCRRGFGQCRTLALLCCAKDLRRLEGPAAYGLSAASGGNNGGKVLKMDAYEAYLQQFRKHETVYGGLDHYDIQRWTYVQLSRMIGLQELILGGTIDPDVSQDLLSDSLGFQYSCLEFSLESRLKLLDQSLAPQVTEITLSIITINNWQSGEAYAFSMTFTVLRLLVNYTSLRDLSPYDGCFWYNDEEEEKELWFLNELTADQMLNQAGKPFLAMKELVFTEGNLETHFEAGSFHCGLVANVCFGVGGIAPARVILVRTSGVQGVLDHVETLGVLKTESAEQVEKNAIVASVGVADGKRQPFVHKPAVYALDAFLEQSEGARRDRSRVLGPSMVDGVSSSEDRGCHETGCHTLSERRGLPDSLDRTFAGLRFESQQWIYRQLERMARLQGLVISVTDYADDIFLDHRLNPETADSIRLEEAVPTFLLAIFNYLSLEMSLESRLDLLAGLRASNGVG